MFVFILNQDKTKSQEKPIANKVSHLRLIAPYLTPSFPHFVMTADRNLHFGRSIEYPNLSATECLVNVTVLVFSQ